MRYEQKAHLQDSNKARMYEDKKLKNFPEIYLLEIIQDICQEHLDNTEIDSINKCEDHHDHYLLGKVDMATEIFKAIMKDKK